MARVPSNDDGTGAASLASGAHDAAASRHDDVATYSFEQARDELADVVSRLEAGGVPLDASLALWERGEALAARCQQWLDGVRERLESVTRADATPLGGAGAEQGDEPF